MATQSFIIKVGSTGAKATAGALKTVGKSIKTMTKLAGLSSISIGAMGYAAKQMVDEFAEFEKVEIGFKNLTKSAGMSRDTFNKLNTAVDGTIEATELMVLANNALLLGVVNTEADMEKLFDSAQRLASVMGKDAAFGVESLVTGMGRQSKLMLDNLGIIVDTNKAYEDYALQLGISSSQLTDNQRKTAFNRATLVAVEEKLQDVGKETLTVQDSLKGASVALNNIFITIGENLAPAFGEAADRFKDFAGALIIEIDKIDIVASLKNSVNNLPTIWQAIKDIFAVNIEFIKNNAWIGFQSMMNGISEIMSGRFFNALKNMRTEHNIWMKNIEKSMLEFAWLPTWQVDRDIAALEAQLESANLDIIDEDDVTTLDELTTQIKDIISKLYADLIVEKEKFDEDTGGLIPEPEPEPVNRFKEMFTEMATTEADFHSKTAKAMDLWGNQFVDNLQKIAEEYPKMAGVAKLAAITQATINTWLTASEMIKQVVATVPYPANIPVAAAAAGSAVTLGMMNVKEIYKAEEGFSGNVSKPTMFMAGEAGAENVQITNLDRVGGGTNSPQGQSIIVNVSGNVMSKDYVEGELMFQIRDAIRKQKGLFRVWGGGNVVAI